MLRDYQEIRRGKKVEEVLATKFHCPRAQRFLTMLLPSPRGNRVNIFLLSFALHSNTGIATTINNFHIFRHGNKVSINVAAAVVLYAASDYLLSHSAPKKSRNALVFWQILKIGGTEYENTRESAGIWLCILKTSAPHKSAEQSTSLSGNTVQYDNNTTMMAKNQLDCFFDGLIDPTFGINDSFNLAKCKRASKSPAGADDNTRRRTGARRGRQTPSNSSAKAGAHDTGSYMYMEQVKTKQHDGSAASKKACDDS